MGTVTSFRDLEVWQAAMDLVVEAYRMTASFPASEQFGLRSQIRRSAVSIPCNIAEGHARRSHRAYLNHLHIALGSQAELDTQIEAAQRLGFIDAASALEIRARVDQVRRMLHGLRRSLELKYGALLATLALLSVLAATAVAA